MGLTGSMGAPAAAPLSPIVAVDERVLPVIKEGPDRWRRWEKVVTDSTSPERPDWSAHLRGSPSTLEAFRGYRASGGAMGHHREWIRSNSMGAKAHAHEHYTLCAAIELLASFDQLN